MRLIDADELMEHVWRDKLDCRGLIAEMVNKAPTVKEIPTNIPISIFERLISQEPCSNCCDGNQIEKAKLCQKSYLAGMEHKQEACEDVISRQEVLKYFEGWKNQIKYYHPYAKNFDIPYEEAIQRIKDVPPVKCVSLEKPNKSGQWIERVERDDWDDYEEVWYECDQCHVGSERVSNYCPACGAKMSEGSGEE